MTNVSTKPRVLVVENDEKTRRFHEMNLTRWHYMPIVVTGVGNGLLANARQKMIEAACHIAIVDMRLINDYDRADRSGLDLIPDLKPALVIIVSGSGDDRQTALAALNKGAYDFIGKEEPLKRLQGALQCASMEMCADNYGPQVVIPKGIVTQIMHSLASEKPEQVCELLKAMFPKAQKILAEPIDGATRTPSVTLRRESFVLKVTPDDLQPFAVKITTIARIRQELDSYKKVIENRMPGLFYGQIQTEHCAERWQMGGIAYRFFGRSGESFTLFSKYYRDATTQQISNAIKHLYMTWRSRYTEKNPNPAALTLFQSYKARWGGERWRNRLDLYIKRLAEEERVDEYLNTFVNPVLWVQRRTGNFGQQIGYDSTALLGDVTEVISHGDLQGDNFFVDDDARSWTIDYERAGFGPIGQDFTLLEFDIWARLAAFPNSRSFLWLLLYMTTRTNIERQKLGMPDDLETQKAYEIIFLIRRPALKGRAPLVLDERVYYWGMLLNSIFRVVLLQEKLENAQDAKNFKKLFQEQERAFLVSAVLCRRLDDWGEPWPPPEWKTKIVTLEAQPGAPIHPSTPLLLFLAANPIDLAALQLEEEFRKIEKIVDGSDRLMLKSHWAVRAYELLAYLLKYKPTILHFGGHGSTQGELIFKNEDGQGTPITSEVLAELFSVLNDNLRCVVLNACYTQHQAEAIGQHIDVVIGTSAAIEDRAAIAFAEGFYQGLHEQRDLQTCFELGKNAIKIKQLPGHELPQLYCRRGNADTITLV